MILFQPMKKQRYNLQEPISDLLERFEREAEADAGAEQRVRRCFIGAGIGFAASFLCLWGGGLLLGFLQTKALILLSPITIVTAAALLIRGFLLKRFDLDDRKIDTVLRFLKVISADTPKGVPLALEIDFRPYQKGGTLEGKPESEGSLTVKRYTHAWLSLTGPLADGSRYRLRVVESFTRKEKAKRKYTKVRESIHGSVRLQLKGAAAGPADAVLEALRAAPPPKPLALRRAAFKAGTLAVELVMPGGLRVEGRGAATEPEAGTLVDADALLKTMLWAFDGVARAGAKKN